MLHAQSMATPPGDEDELAGLEAAARRALGAMGGPPAPQAGGAPRGSSVVRFTPRRAHRFVRDGEVPVERVSGLHGRAQAPVAAQAVLDAERNARQRAERTLAIAQETIRSLQAEAAQVRRGRDAALAQVKAGQAELSRAHKSLASREFDLGHALRQQEAAAEARRAAEQALEDERLARPAAGAAMPGAAAAMPDGIAADALACALAAAATATRAIAASRNPVAAVARILAARPRGRARA